MRSWRIATAVATAFALVALHAPVSWACSCKQATTRQHVRSADAVFVGMVTVTRVGHPDDPMEVGFAVHAVYKGDVGETYALVTPQAQRGVCGVPFVVGHRYAVFASIAEDGVPRTTSCSGTSSDARILPRAGFDEPLRTYDPARGEPVASGTPRPPDPTARTGALVAAALLLVVAGGWLGIRWWQEGRPTGGG